MNYPILYADPAWLYKDKANAGHRGAGHKYSVMSTQELCRLPVGDMAAKDSALFMWGVPPMMPDAFEVMKAWGFQYKTFAFVWIKTTKEPEHTLWSKTDIGKTCFGMGNWSRANAEIVLLGTRGKPQRQAKNVRQLIFSPRRKHSQKPPETRERIVALLGDLPRVELFARERAPGWDAIGNELGTLLTPKEE